MKDQHPDWSCPQGVVYTQNLQSIFSHPTALHGCGLVKGLDHTFHTQTLTETVRVVTVTC